MTGWRVRFVRRIRCLMAIRSLPLATGSHTASSVNSVGILAAEVVAAAIVNAVTV